MKKISLIKKNYINLQFMIFAATVELNCNGKIFKSQINLIFFDQTDFFHKQWFCLVLLYMWVTYELIKTSFSAQNEDFRFLVIFAIINPIVN